MKKYFYNLVFCISTLLITPTNAEAIGYALCDVVADQYLIQKNGLLSVRYTLINPLPNRSPGNLYSTLCGVNEAYRGVTVETCLAWQNMFIDSIETGNQLRIRFPINTPEQSLFPCVGNHWTNSPPPDYIIYNWVKSS